VFRLRALFYRLVFYTLSPSEAASELDRRLIFTQLLAAITPDIPQTGILIPAIDRHFDISRDLGIAFSNIV